MMLCAMHAQPLQSPEGKSYFPIDQGFEPILTIVDLEFLWTKIKKKNKYKYITNFEIILSVFEPATLATISYFLQIIREMNYQVLDY